MSGSGSKKTAADKGKYVHIDWTDAYTPEPPQPQVRYNELDLNFVSPTVFPQFDDIGRPTMNVEVPLARNLEGEFAGPQSRFQYDPHFLATGPTAHSPAIGPTAHSPVSPGHLRSSQSSRSRMSGDEGYLALTAGPHVSGGIEDLTLGQEEEAVEEEEEGSQARRGTKGKQYTKAADLVLINAWLKISQDAKKGTEQTAPTFWGRIRRQCLADDVNFFTHKTWVSCKSRWGRISRVCNEFNGIYARHSGSRARSGENEQDYYKNAVEEYDRKQATMPKPSYWDFELQWKMLRDHPKWVAYKADPLHESMTYRTRGSGSGSGGEGSGSGSKRATPSDSRSMAPDRPEGRDAAKRAAKGKGKMTKKDANEEKLRCAELRANLNTVNLQLSDLTKQLSKSQKITDKKGEAIWRAVSRDPNDDEDTVKFKKRLAEKLDREFEDLLRANKSFQERIDVLLQQKSELELALGL